MADHPFEARRSGALRTSLYKTAQNVSLSVLFEDEELLLPRSTSNKSILAMARSQRLNNVGSNLSLSNSMLLDDNDDCDRGKSKTDILFSRFLEILQSHSNDSETFDVLKELSQVCRGVVEQLEFEIERGVGGDLGAKQREASITWLKQEINTWRLLHALYYDRVLLQAETTADDEMNDGPTLGGSEKEVITQLYTINATLREYQLVVDWLEACYEQGENVNALRCHDRMMAWENTLFQLENLQGAAFGRGHEIVEKLDPDAPVREKRPLHALDEEDNLRLARAVFACIRSGCIDDALRLCKHYGQTWRAAILEGWRLHEDPNYEQHAGENEKLPIEGNPRRDVWKKCAWMLADSKKYDEYTRATAGVFCGHLGALKSLLKSSWHDLLWGYMKVQIDIRVEGEIRGCCMKRYHPMPDEYWNSKMTLEQIFDELAVAKDVAVRDYSQCQMGVIQQHLILDTCGELLQHMCRWLESAKEPLPSHQLRFMTHIVLFLRQIGRVDQQQYAERIIAAYVESLIDRKDPQLIAYYAVSLPNKLQVQLYSKFLEQVEGTRAREVALEAAVNSGLDIKQITQYTVETIRQSTISLNDSVPRAGEISAGDKRKIMALEWLTLMIEQRGELLWQANAMIRHYLASSKIECVREAFLMIPADVVRYLMTTYGSVENLPPHEECSLKEYLCYKVYLSAIDSFNEWTRLQQSRPQLPQVLKSSTSGNFTERMATEHKELAYRNEITRWEQKLKEQSKQTTDALYNVLLFPEKGWLVDPLIARGPKSASTLNWENRLIQMEKLRSICLPEITLLLHEVLYKAGDYAGCVRLADEISNEHRQLYKVYTKHKLAELLAKIADASLELLNSKLDPWGYPITT